ncbi:1602_t:CDS:2 [Entrophospora sp. SA101]|nr:1602_t:CDS:2 [Entrophospora sp. SA101]
MEKESRIQGKKERVDDGKYLRPEMLGLRYQSQHIKRGKNICLTAY